MGAANMDLSNGSGWHPASGPTGPQPQRRRDRPVRDAEGHKIGRVHQWVSAPGGEEMFCLIVLGSMSRLGDDVRAVPVRLLADANEDDSLVLLCQADLVRGAPIHVDGARCGCAAWYVRVRDHFSSVETG